MKTIKEETTQTLKDMIIDLSFYEETREHRAEILEELLSRVDNSEEINEDIDNLFKKIYSK